MGRKASLIFVLFVLICESTFGQSLPVVVALLNSDAIQTYLDPYRSLKSRQLKFQMASAGGASSFQASASVKGALEQSQMVELFRALGLAAVVSEMDGPWRVTVVGDNLAAEVEVSPASDCSQSTGMHWRLSNQGNRWVVVERLPPLVSRPCVPTP